jgi:GNAT superfamily N-acetyltransferase
MLTIQLTTDYAYLAKVEETCYLPHEAWEEIDYIDCADVLRCFLVAIDSEAAGSVILQPNQGLRRPKKGSLYVVGTALLPQFRGLGYAAVLKAWQLAYAKQNGFKWLCGHIRESNRASIAMNERFGIAVTGVQKNYYASGELAYTYNHKI